MKPSFAYRLFRTVSSGLILMGAVACGNPAGSSDQGTSSAPSTPGAPGVDITSATVGTLRAIPSGTFQRNATATDLAQVSAFHLAATEVTRDQWTAIMGPSTDPSMNFEVLGPTAGLGPVIRVGWFHAIVFCNKLSLKEGLTPVYRVPGIDFSTVAFSAIPLDVGTVPAPWSGITADWSANGYRLPTEMEWRWASMGADLLSPGATNRTGYLLAFAGSSGTNALGDYAWYQGNRPGSLGAPTYRTQPVGTKLPNALGLYDMTGNAYEWLWDFYGGYPAGTLVDYRGSSEGSVWGYERLYRGGAFNSTEIFCSLGASSMAMQQGLRNQTVGFRVARN